MKCVIERKRMEIMNIDKIQKIKLQYGFKDIDKKQILRRLNLGILDVLPEVENRFVTRGRVLAPFIIPLVPDSPDLCPDAEDRSSISHVEVCGIIRVVNLSPKTPILARVNNHIRAGI
ncbi:hypothetical protein B9Z55_009938 [Caenorhabditis nigoni]|uniref:Uncharacterized protein n=1 Tax=Caenorhabditis nigoni TaxID=1611254 RepID=A0A2G5UU56_9PELO|nr:hypothetical protein B9Z55_009938 [Caenorhabditis nigoni]